MTAASYSAQGRPHVDHRQKTPFSRVTGSLANGVGHTEARGLLLYASLAALLMLAFYVPAWQLLAQSGLSVVFPAPLDDTYIYFDYARSTARGCVLCYSEQGGYSSGATSPPYALLLAAGYLVGFRGEWLGLFAGLLALASLTFGLEFARRAAGRGLPSLLLTPWILFAIPALNWSLVSGMEAAWVLLVLALAVHRCRLAVEAAPHVRATEQRIAGVVLALLALSRPEFVGLALLLGVAVAHGAGALSLPRSLARSVLPVLSSLAAMALLNRLLTGESQAAGALRKLSMHNPYASGPDLGIEFVKNLLRLWTEGLEIASGGRFALWGFVLLGACGLTDRRTRRWVLALWGGGVAALLLVCLNNTAPFQNLRYLVPSWLSLLMAALLGAATLTKRLRFQRLGWLVTLACLLPSALALRGMARETDHFARSARNIQEQQVSIGKRLHGSEARGLFVGDAGAIAYFADLPTVDGLGLGGTRGLPFAEASVHGWPAVIELVERMPPAQRPDTLAIYDSWWPGLGATFGKPWFSVTIDDNVICGHPEKSVYHADWTLLEERSQLGAKTLQRTDVGDLVDERLASLEFTRPRGGYIVQATLRDEHGVLRWDAGRVLSAGQQLSLRYVGPQTTHATLLIDTDSESSSATIQAPLGSYDAEQVSTPKGAFAVQRARLSTLGPGDPVSILVREGALRVYALRFVEHP